MLNRRLLLAAAATLALAAPSTAAETGAAWKEKYPELVYAIIPAENSGTVIDRWTPFVDYLSQQLGTKVTLRVANDYAAMIEGQRSGNIHIAQYGPASYARARMTGVKIEPFAIEVNADGTRGYYSGAVDQSGRALPEDRGSEGQKPVSGRPQLNLRK